MADCVCPQDNRRRVSAGGGVALSTDFAALQIKPGFVALVSDPFQANLHQRLVLTIPVYCGVAVRLDGGAGGGVTTVSDAVVIAPPALAFTSKVPVTLEREVLVNVVSAGREDVIPKVREAQAIESLVTDTVKLAGDPAFTEALA